MGHHSAAIRILKTLDLSVAAVWYVSLLLLTGPAIEDVSINHFLSLRMSVGNLVLFVVLLACWHLALLVSGVYHTPPTKSALGQYVDIVQGTALAALVWLALGIAFELSFSRIGFVAIFSVGTATLMVLTRTLLRLRLHRRRS